VIGQRILVGAWVIWIALRIEQRAMLSRPMVYVVAIIQPVTLLFIVAGTRQLSPERATTITSAVFLTAMWGTTVYTAGGVLRRERTQGTLARNVTSLYSPSLVVFGKSLGATIYALIGILCSCTAVIAALGLRVALPSPGWLLAALLALIASGTALGMLLACLFLVTRHGLTWSSALIYPVFILGGLLIPPERLPSALRWVPSILSLHWVQEFTVALGGGRVRADVLGIAGLLTIVYIVLAVAGLRIAVDAARRKGSLDFY
jgi:ABC-2 type transport system permease protein